MSLTTSEPTPVDLSTSAGALFHMRRFGTMMQEIWDHIRDMDTETQQYTSLFAGIMGCVDEYINAFIHVVCTLHMNDKLTSEVPFQSLNLVIPYYVSNYAPKAPDCIIWLDYLQINIERIHECYDHQPLDEALIHVLTNHPSGILDLVNLLEEELRNKNLLNVKCHWEF
jgi:hypothetical protein